MAHAKEPPDKYRCLKVPLTSILKKNQDNHEMVEKLQDAIIRANQITMKAYMLLRLWILEKFHHRQTIPQITVETIKIALIAVREPAKGNQPKEDNFSLMREFRNLYEFVLEK